MLLLPILIAYLVGSIPFALIVARLFGAGDLRTQGSGNIGATNVWRVAGLKAAVWVFAGDIGKGAAAVLLARLYAQQYPISLINQESFLILCALAAVLGHLFPIYIGFKGGKGVNTALGAMVALLPIEALLSLGVFLVLVISTKYVSLGSIAGAVAFLLILLVEKYSLEQPVPTEYVVVAALIAALIIVAHRSNIVRLLNGTENKLTRGPSSKEANSHA